MATVREFWTMVQLPMESGLPIAIGVVIALECALGALYLLQRRRTNDLEGRLVSLTAAVTLLTDTMEGGLQDVAREVGRLGSASAAAAPRARAATQRRVRTAATRGRAVTDIAASEQMSEGEVRLMLQLGKGQAASAREPLANASMR